MNFYSSNFITRTPYKNNFQVELNPLLITAFKSKLQIN